MENDQIQVAEKIKSQILNLNDSVLQSPNLANALFTQIKVSVPTLVKERTVVNTGKIIADHSNTPTHMTFSYGEAMEYALYSIPIDGSAEVLKKLITRSLYENKIYISGNNLFYKEFSNVPIVGNQEEIDRIKQNFLKFIALVQDLIESAVKEAEEFNENVVKKEINEAITTEIERRKSKGSAESQLNPFL
jgi:hypothetical protein